MLRLLLDENVSPAIVPPLWQHGIDAEHLRDRGLLSATDYGVWRYAVAERRTIVTVNGKDFYKLAAQEATHPGVVVIPSGCNRAEQLACIMSAVEWTGQNNVFINSFVNYFVEVDEARTVSPLVLHGNSEAPVTSNVVRLN